MKRLTRMVSAVDSKSVAKWVELLARNDVGFV